MSNSDNDSDINSTDDETDPDKHEELKENIQINSNDNSDDVSKSNDICEMDKSRNIFTADMCKFDETKHDQNATADYTVIFHRVNEYLCNLIDYLKIEIQNDDKTFIYCIGILSGGIFGICISCGALLFGLSYLLDKKELYKQIIFVQGILFIWLFLGYFVADISIRSISILEFSRVLFEIYNI